MLKLSGLHKFLLLSGSLLALSYGLVSCRAHASSYLGSPSGGASHISKHKKLNHNAVSIRALGLFGSHQSMTEGLSAAELARLDLKLLSADSKPRLPTPAFDLSLISLVKYGGVIVHF
jgi:hypothetical protein